MSDFLLRGDYAYCEGINSIDSDGSMDVYHPSSIPIGQLVNRPIVRSWTAAAFLVPPISSSEPESRNLERNCSSRDSYSRIPSYFITWIILTYPYFLYLPDPHPAPSTEHGERWKETVSHGTRPLGRRGGCQAVPCPCAPSYSLRWFHVHHQRASAS